MYVNSDVNVGEERHFCTCTPYDGIPRFTQFSNLPNALMFTMWLILPLEDSSLPCKYIDSLCISVYSCLYTPLYIYCILIFPTIIFLYFLISAFPYNYILTWTYFPANITINSGKKKEHPQRAVSYDFPPWLIHPPSPPSPENKFLRSSATADSHPRKTHFER